jgi:hypothetical protein
MPFEENGIWINFPDANYFQFQAMPSYQGISSQSVKEMDFGWFDAPNDTLYLVELKAYYHPGNPMHRPTDLSDGDVRETKLQELREKSIHSLSMLYNTRSPVRAALPLAHLSGKKLRLIHILSIPNGLISYLLMMQDLLRHQLKPYAAIFDINSVAIIDYETACSLFTWVGKP